MIKKCSFPFTKIKQKMTHITIQIENIILYNINRKNMIQGLKDACSDDALWLVSAVVEYIKETGEMEFLKDKVTYADKGEDTIYEHLKTILDFSAKQVGASGICKGLRADWNDCLNLGGGESAMVSFLHYWALQNL
jgi:Cellobiose phosphorylase